MGLITVYNFFSGNKTDQQQQQGKDNFCFSEVQVTIRK